MESLLGMKCPPELAWELLVVNNNSSDRTKAVVESIAEKNHGRIRYLFEARQGKSYALNTAVEAARGAILAFTDDDVTVDPYWLTNLKRIFDTYDCQGVGGKIIPLFEVDPPAWLKLDTPHPFLNALVAFDFGEMPSVLKTPPFGANMAFKKEVFDRHGSFRTDLGPVQGNLLGKGEDSEFASRLLLAGEPLMYAPDAIIYHPVEKERMRKEYFKRWYFNFGRALVLRSPSQPESTASICGVPRYLYRRFLGTLMKWCVAMDADSRYRGKLDLYQTAGEISESFNLSRTSRNQTRKKQRQWNVDQI